MENLDMWHTFHTFAKKITTMEKMRLVFATNNAHKLEEIREMAGGQYEIVSLKEIGCQEEIPEEQDRRRLRAVQLLRSLCLLR